MANQAYCRPADNIAPNATWSVVSGTANSAYPVGNVGNRNPGRPFKATGTSVRIRATFGSPQILLGVALFNHNLAGASSVAILSGASLNQAIPIAPNQGVFCTPPILDFSAALLAQRTSTTFDIDVAGGVLGNIAIGEVALLTAIRDLRWVYGLRMKPKRLVTRQSTFGGTHLQYNKRIRILTASGRVELQTEEAAMRLLEEEAQGEVQPWVLWPERAVNHACFVKFLPGTFEWSPKSFGSTEMPIEVEEVSSGPPLF